jgi:hypothetical protein
MVMKLKQFYIIALFLSVCSITKTTGQVLRNYNNKIEKFNLNSSALSNRIQQLKGLEEKSKLGLSLNFSVMKPDLHLNAILIGRSNDFNIYELSLDNMPCIVPSESYLQNMNAINQKFIKSDGLDSRDNIPNPFKTMD